MSTGSLKTNPAREGEWRVNKMWEVIVIGTIITLEIIMVVIGALMSRSTDDNRSSLGGSLLIFGIFLLVQAIILICIALFANSWALTLS